MYLNLLLIAIIVALAFSTFCLATSIIITFVLVNLWFLNSIFSQNWIFDLEELRPNYHLPWYDITILEFIVYKLKSGLHNLSQRLYNIGWDQYEARLQLPQSLLDNPSAWQLMLYMIQVMWATLLWDQMMMLCNILDLMKKWLQTLLLHLRVSHQRDPLPQG